MIIQNAITVGEKVVGLGKPLLDQPVKPEFLVPAAIALLSLAVAVISVRRMRRNGNKLQFPNLLPGEDYEEAPGNAVHRTSPNPPDEPVRPGRFEDVDQWEE